MTARARPLATRLRKVAALPWAERWLLFEVFCLLGIARLTLLLIPFRHLARRLGPLHTETPPDAPPAHVAHAQRVGQAIARVSPHTPWTSNCFPQALVAKYWLQRRRIPTTLYLGVALTKDAASTPARMGGGGFNLGAPKLNPGGASLGAPRPKLNMEAHAWLRCGPLIVTGERGHARFTVTAAFGG